MMRRISILTVLVAGVALLAACDIPRGAALRSEILGKTQKEDAGFAVYLVDKTVVPMVAKWPRTGLQRSDGWLPRRRGPASQIITAGDRLELSIWDSDQNSLLTAPEQKSVTMNEVRVSPDGTIFVPYLDRIYVSGMTTDKARAAIQSELEMIIASAQVQLKLVSGRRNSVDLVGGVANAGNYPLPDRDFTVLNLVSLGGGIPSSLRNPQVRLMRGRKIYVTSAATLYAHPDLDTTLHGGDKVIVAEDTRNFIALGATGTENLMYFTKDRVSALDALSMIGGLADTRANPEGVLILRQYPEKTVRDDGKGPSKSRVVFSIDLTSTDGLFSARNFEINPGDLVLATESPVTAIATILSLFGQAISVRNKL